MKFMAIIYSSYFPYFLPLGSALLSTTLYKVRSVSNTSDYIQEVTGSHLRRDHEYNQWICTKHRS